MPPRRTAPAVLALLAVALGVGILAVLLMPNPGANRSTARPVVVEPAAHTVHAGGTAVSSTLDGPTTAPADEAFLADLFDGQATDLPAQQIADLTAIGHRICDLGQPRAEWLAALTASGPHALTDGEATKLFDVSIAAFCPERIPPVAVEQPTAAPAPAPIVEQPAPTATPAPVVEPAPADPSCAPGEEWQDEFGCVAVQLPEETVGRQIDG
jgi:Protein of unknown function (DUF732)